MGEVGQIKSEQEQLVRLLSDAEADGAARQKAATALGTMGETAAPHLVKLLGSPDFRTRRAAERAVRAMDADLSKSCSIAHANSYGGQAQLSVTRALGLLPSARPSANEIAGVFKNTDEGARAAAAEALGRLGGDGAAHATELATLLGDPAPAVRQAAVTALPKLGEAGLKAATGALDKVVEFQVSSAHAGQVLQTDENGESRLAPLLSKRYGHAPAPAARVSAKLLQPGERFDAVAASAIGKLLQDQDPDVQAAACTSLQRMGSVGVAEADRILEAFNLERNTTSDAVDRSMETLRDVLPVPQEPVVLDSRARTVATIHTQLANASKETTRELLQTASLLKDPVMLGSRARTAGASYLAELAGSNIETLTELQAVSLLKEPSMLSSIRVRTAAAEALSTSPAALEACSREVAVLLRDQSAPARKAAAEALGRMAHGRWRAHHADEVAELLRDGDSSVRASAAEVLGQMGADGSRHAPAVANLLSDDQESVRVSAGASLGLLQDARGAQQAATYLQSPQLEVRIAAAVALGRMAASAARQAPEVASLLADRCADVRAAAEWALQWMTGSSASRLTELLQHPECFVRSAAARALGRLNGAGAEEVVALLNHREVYIRCSAIDALGAMGDAAGDHVDAVAGVLDRPRATGTLQDRWPVKLAAARALATMGSTAIVHAPKVVLLLHEREPTLRAAAAASLAQLVILSVASRWM